jgi:hypothetical protein
VLAIGVSYDDYWHGEPALVRYAIEADEIVQRNRVVSSDLLAWNTGRYVMLAVGVVLSQAFSRSSSAKYPVEPIIAAELDEKLAENRRERELRQMEANFLAMARRDIPRKDGVTADE